MAGSKTVTLVTCYYRIPGAKHSFEDYDAWSSRFLSTVDTPMVVFCGDTETARRLAQLRARVARLTRVVVLPLAKTHCGSGRLGALWPQDMARDPEARYHTPDLFLIWNNKSDFVARAMALDPFGSDVYAWCDIGCFRADEGPDRYRRWPRSSALDAACARTPDALSLLCVKPFESGDFVLAPDGLPPSFERVNRIGGTIMVGTRAAWNRWIPAYYRILDDFVAAFRFAGKDQSLMAALVVLRPDLAALVSPSQRPEDGDPWFYLQPHFCDLKKS